MKLKSCQATLLAFLPQGSTEPDPHVEIKIRFPKRELLRRSRRACGPPCSILGIN